MQHGWIKDKSELITLSPQELTHLLRDSSVVGRINEPTILGRIGGGVTHPEIDTEGLSQDTGLQDLELENMDIEAENIDIEAGNIDIEVRNVEIEA